MDIMSIIIAVTAVLSLMGSVWKLSNISTDVKAQLARSEEAERHLQKDMEELRDRVDKLLDTIGKYYVPRIELDSRIADLSRRISELEKGM
jgi:chromosome segregation ATPase